MTQICRQLFVSISIFTSPSSYKSTYYHDHSARRTYGRIKIFKTWIIGEPRTGAPLCRSDSARNWYLLRLQLRIRDQPCKRLRPKALYRWPQNVTKITTIRTSPVNQPPWILGLLRVIFVVPWKYHRPTCLTYITGFKFTLTIDNIPITSISMNIRSSKITLLSVEEGTTLLTQKKITVFPGTAKVGPICPTFIRGDPYEPHRAHEKVTFSDH